MSILLGLTTIVGALLAVLVFTILRFRSAAREALETPAARPGSALVTDVMQEAFSRLRDQGREMQARAEASERLAEHVIGSMQSGLLLVETDGRIRVINAASRQLLGLGDAAEDDDYQRVLQHVPGLRDTVTQALMHGGRVTRRTIQIETVVRGAFHVSVAMSPVHDPDGGLQSVVCLFDDVTAMVALEQRLRLQDSLARLGELTAGIAHEFRNGLATIHGYARLIDPAQLPASYAEYVAGIRAETSALGEVVTNFLNFARPAPLTVGPVDVRALLDRAADDLRPAVEAAGGRIDVDVEAAPIEGDEVLLRQAFSNLCRNAWEACETTGRPAHIRLVAASDDQGGVQITVSDNGPGIDPAAASRLFQPFFTTRTKGTGLGLALVQKIVVTHNGQISASNATGTGAVFDVHLPAHPGDRVA